MSRSKPFPPETNDAPRRQSDAALLALLQDAPQQALQQATTELARDPSDPLRHLVRAEATRRIGDVSGALRWVRDSRERLPGYPPLGLEEARALRTLGDLTGACRVIEGVLTEHPEFIPGWRALSDLRAELGDNDGARRAAERLQSAHPTASELVQATDLLQRGKLGEAEHVLRRYVHDHPTDVSGIRLLADLGNRLGVADDARKLLERCLELAPDYHMARHDYANALIKLQSYDQAELEIARLKAAEPENQAHRVLDALLHVRTDRYTEAISVYESILRVFPRQAKLWLSLGHALKTVGHQEKAIEAYRQAACAQPELGEAYWSLANLKTFRFSDDDIAAMKHQISTGTLSHADRYHMSFALGKALEDRKAYADAFKAYEQGNLWRRKGIRYDADRNRQELDVQEAFFTQRFFAERAAWGHPSTEPIFIVGLPRSGSTLLEQILASHSQVEGTFELPDILSMVKRLSGRKRPSDPSDYPAILARLNRAEICALGEEYLDRTRIHRTGQPHFIDKMPNNFAHAGFIHLILPNARIIDARRHPLACCFSNYKQLFARGQNFTYDLDEIAQYYLDYAGMMRAWDLAMPGHVTRVIYEDMIADPDTQVRRLLEACDLAFEPACLAFHETERAVRTASSEQVRQPIYTSSLEQWRHFDPHLHPVKHRLDPLLQPVETWKR
jgi:predicted Zn-dependent protease